MLLRWQEQEQEEKGWGKRLEVHGSNLVCFDFFVLFLPRLFSGFSLISIGRRALIAAPGGYLQS